MANEALDIGSLLGKDADFTGKLSFRGTVRIEGAFNGDILSDDTLVVADGGLIRGKVEVGNLVVTGGVVEAEVIAAQSVEIMAGGKIVGDVTTPALQIEKGAIFAGQSHMTPDSAM